jgi:hypothetical protein
MCEDVHSESAAKAQARSITRDSRRCSGQPQLALDPLNGILDAALIRADGDFLAGRQPVRDFLLS